MGEQGKIEGKTFCIRGVTVSSFEKRKSSNCKREVERKKIRKKFLKSEVEKETGGSGVDLYLCFWDSRAINMLRSWESREGEETRDQRTVDYTILQEVSGLLFIAALVYSDCDFVHPCSDCDFYSLLH